MTDHTVSEELRKVLTKLGAHPIVKNQLPRLVYGLETKCAALLLRAQGAEKEVERLLDDAHIKEERLKLLQQRLDAAESNIASLTRSLERVQVEHEAAVAAGLKATG